MSATAGRALREGDILDYFPIVYTKLDQEFQRQEEAGLGIVHWEDSCQRRSRDRSNLLEKSARVAKEWVSR